MRRYRQRLLLSDCLLCAEFLYRYARTALFGDGNTRQAMVGASLLLWFVHALVLRGVQTAASINLAATLAKLVPLGLFIVLAAMAFHYDTFSWISPVSPQVYRYGSR